MEKNNELSPLTNTLKYTLYICLLYAGYEYLQPDSPHGKDFIVYIIVKSLVDVIVFIFPALYLFFYFRDNSVDSNIIDTFINKNNPQMKEFNNQEMLREYHTMLKEGIITQEEYDTIKKRYLKSVGKEN